MRVVLGGDLVRRGECVLSVQAIIASLRLSLENCRSESAPYRFWILDRVLPEACARDIAALPFPPPEIADTRGKRDTHNEVRTFFSAGNRDRFEVCAEVAEAFQAPETVRMFESAFGARLAGRLLRIEYCQDTNGFWLEPHTDIGAKVFTMQLHLSDAPPGEDWSTDIYDGPERLAASFPANFNTALVFIPGDDTWHGFRRRPISGIRRSIIVNYVKDEWRSRHELAFPDSPVA